MVQRTLSPPFALREPPRLSSFLRYVVSYGTRCSVFFCDELTEVGCSTSRVSSSFSTCFFPVFVFLQFRFLVLSSSHTSVFGVFLGNAADYSIFLVSCMFGLTRLAGLCVFTLHSMLPVVVDASSFAGDYFLGSARASCCLAWAPTAVLILLYGIWQARISVESEPPSRVVNTASLLQVVLTNFLTTGECCLLVEVDSARTRRESRG